MSQSCMQNILLSVEYIGDFKSSYFPPEAIIASRTDCATPIGLGKAPHEVFSIPIGTDAHITLTRHGLANSFEDS